MKCTHNYRMTHINRKLIYSTVLVQWSRITYYACKVLYHQVVLLYSESEHANQKPQVFFWEELAFVNKTMNEFASKGKYLMSIKVEFGFWVVYMSSLTRPHLYKNTAYLFHFSIISPLKHKHGRWKNMINVLNGSRAESVDCGQVGSSASATLMEIGFCVDRQIINPEPSPRFFS